VRVFFQSKGESIVINGDITVTVLKVVGDEVVLEIDAPDWLTIEEGPELHLRRSGVDGKPSGLLCAELVRHDKMGSTGP